MHRPSSTRLWRRTTSAHSGGLRAAGKVEEPLFEGVLELLDALEADGWLLAVATGKSDRGLTHCLESHGLHARFVSLQTADRHPSKPHPSMVEQAIADAGARPETSFVVGDTSFDMAMAAAAGAAPIGAAWGYHDAEELIEAGAVAVAERPIEVLELVREPCPWMTTTARRRLLALFARASGRAGDLLPWDRDHLHEPGATGAAGRRSARLLRSSA